MLLGRWTSSAIEKYIQQAALQVLPEISSQALHHEALPRRAEPLAALLDQPGRTPAAPAPATPTVVKPVMDHSPEIAALQSAHHTLEGLVQDLRNSFAALSKAVPKPDHNLVVRCKSMVVHLGMDFERDNWPSTWRTKCGWPYGASKFFRVPSVVAPYRECRKCFNLEDSSDESARPDSAPSQHSSSDSDSTASSAVD
eukprot:Skav205339  [mRNA]  locus=scaffold3444:507915:508508:- [translate_table: standard]